MQKGRPTKQRRPATRKPLELTAEQVRLITRARLFAQFLVTRFPADPTPETLVALLESELEDVKKEFLPHAKG